MLLLRYRMRRAGEEFDDEVEIKEGKQIAMLSKERQQRVVDTLRALLASGLTASRPQLGTEARTVGPFASSFHAQILPTSFDVVDDPTLKSFDGKGLVGAYDVDDEAVPAQAVKLVDGGRLVSYLIGRQPVRGIRD